MDVRKPAQANTQIHKIQMIHKYLPISVCVYSAIPKSTGKFSKSVPGKLLGAKPIIAYIFHANACMYIYIYTYFLSQSVDFI